MNENVLPTQKIITKDEIHDIVKTLNHYKKAVIFGKGPTLKFIDKNENENVFFVCINNTINYIKKCDLLVCNDIESFDDIELENLKNCKNILIPYHLHVNCKFNEQITYKNVINKINNYFNGNLIIYNLRSSKRNYVKFIKLYSGCTSVHTGFEFIEIFLKNIKHVYFYGFAKKANERDINLYTNTKKELEKKHYKNYNKYIKEINIINKNNNIKYILH